MTLIIEQALHRLTVISIARCDLNIEQLVLVIHYQMEFEAKEPIHRGFATSRYASEDFVAADATLSIRGAY